VPGKIAGQDNPEDGKDDIDEGVHRISRRESSAYPIAMPIRMALMPARVRVDFVDAETNCTGNFCRKKAIEKTVLRILGSSAFSHSLGQKPT
jgi:hypothetical protein